ncbi:hypothetical protein QR680_000196 [Steinernema hermaphroditum]|uniref:Nematode cuticle collagen N-terminal domain-containing protein n=1 Tax=Steinernema hermaphroditum TaxID=289476 RepID=A0AA39LD67_9BILA|nr:hypothetical protein QR680_000196 [Steinernema hermaphroditum]
MLVPSSRRATFLASVASTVSVLTIIVALPLMHHYVQRTTSLMLSNVEMCKLESRDIWKQMNLASTRSVRKARLKDQPEHVDNKERMESRELMVHPDWTEFVVRTGNIYPLLLRERTLVRSVHLAHLDHPACPDLKDLADLPDHRDATANPEKTIAPAHLDRLVFVESLDRPGLRDPSVIAERFSTVPLLALPVPLAELALAERLAVVVTTESPESAAKLEFADSLENVELPEMPVFPDLQALLEILETLDLVLIARTALVGFLTVELQHPPRSPMYLK